MHARADTHVACACICSVLQRVAVCSSAFHLPTRGPRVGARGGFSISRVGSRLPRRKGRKGSGGRELESGVRLEIQICANRPFLVGGAAAGAACQGQLLSDLLCSLFLPRHTQPVASSDVAAAEISNVKFVLPTPEARVWSHGWSLAAASAERFKLSWAWVLG